MRMVYGLIAGLAVFLVAEAAAAKPAEGEG